MSLFLIKDQNVIESTNVWMLICMIIVHEAYLEINNVIATTDNIMYINMILYV